MKKFIMIILIVSWAFPLTGIELAQLMDDRETPLDIKVNLVMTLTNKKGKTRTSSLRSITKDDGKKQIIWFLSPADDKGVAFLKIENDDRDDEMRMWLPAFKKVRRISAKKRSDSFMGSDMSYEDMSTRQLDEFEFALIGAEVLQDVPCHLLESTPKEKIRTEYSRHVSWVDTTLLVPLKEESYDKNGELLKEKYFSYTSMKDYHILNEVTVKNIQKNHSTLLRFENIDVDSGVEDNLFHEKYLKRLPK